MDYSRDPITVARALLGQRLVRMIKPRIRIAGFIVEVEAYLGREDKAAHTFGGRRTPRNESMYLPGGHAYVYFTYGIHHCMNVVCGEQDEGVAVLIRALEPEEGIEHMFANRGQAAKRETDLCSGPAKLCQALGIDRSLDGLDLRSSGELWIEQVTPEPLAANSIQRSPRIGVAYAAEWAGRPLRFAIRSNPHVSRRTSVADRANPIGESRS